MSKKRSFITISVGLLSLLLLFLAFNKPINILSTSKKVYQIKIYNIELDKSVEISDKKDIDIYVKKLKKLKVKRDKLIGNYRAKGFNLILKDESGNTIDSLYMSENEIIYNHFIVEILSGDNFYEDLYIDFYK